MLLGNHPARIDEKGRLKVPAAFRAAIESQWGADLFATSVRGDAISLYPMPVWVEIQRRVALDPDFPRKNMLRLNALGQVLSLDTQGRIVLPQQLRQRAAVTGDVSVVGMTDHLQVWDQQRLDADFLNKPLTEEDEKALARYGIL